MATGSIKLLMKSLKDYMTNLKTTAPTYVFSTDKIKSVSIDYTTIDLDRPTRWVRIFYSRKTTAAYMAHMANWDSYLESVVNYYNTNGIVRRLRDYVVAWSNNKAFIKENFDDLRSLAEGHRNRCSYQYGRMYKNWEYFQERNVETDDMVSYFDTRFKEPITAFPYVRAYNYLFRKRRVDINQVRQLIETNMNALDEMVNMVAILDSGWDKCGKDQSFEDYRFAQRELLDCVRITADAIELEMKLYELVLQFNNTVVNFKVFPMN